VFLSAWSQVYHSSSVTRILALPFVTLAMLYNVAQVVVSHKLYKGAGFKLYSDRYL